MKYTIGSLSFKTKKDCHNYTKNIISGIGCKKVCKDDEHYTFLLSLLYNHDEYVEKIGAGIDYFFIVPNAMNKTALQVMIKRIDNTEIDFSWVYCCQFKQRDDDYNLTLAMRDAISSYTIDYKKNNKLICNICGSDNEPYKNYETDHIEPFSIIKQNFLLNYKKDIIPKLFDDNKYNNTAMFRICDLSFKNDWINFHNSIAKYQILCKACNLNKSNS